MSATILRAAPREMTTRFMLGASMRSLARRYGVSRGVVEYRLWLAMFTPAERRKLGREKKQRMREKLGVTPSGTRSALPQSSRGT